MEKQSKINYEMSNELLRFRMSNISKKLKKIRMEKGLTQSQVGYYSSLTQPIISKIENNPNYNPSLLSILKISYVLNVPVSELMSTN